MNESARELPAWLEELDEPDLQFIKRFVLASGSLKELARLYGVSYPTVRSRLDRLIAKVSAASDTESDDALERKVRVLVADGQLSTRAARELVAAHRLAQNTKSGQRRKGAK